MTHDEQTTGVAPDTVDVAADADPDRDLEDFKPTGTIFVLTLFVAAMVLLWASVYVILLSRGVTL